MAESGWRFWIDRGGTFTDVVARSPAGRLQVAKVLSEQTEQQGDPAVNALRRMLGLSDPQQSREADALRAAGSSPQAAAAQAAG